MHQQINDMLWDDIIRPSKSPWGGPVNLICQKELHGKPQPPRFVIDDPPLNSVTKSNGFPLPQIIDIFDWLGGGKSFAKLDLGNGCLWRRQRENICRLTLRIIWIHFCALWSQDHGHHIPRTYTSHIFWLLMVIVTGSTGSQTRFCVPLVIT